MGNTPTHQAIVVFKRVACSKDCFNYVGTANIMVLESDIKTV